MRSKAFASLVLVVFVLVPGKCLADGCYVFRWNKAIDIREPTQKAIILYDQGREDLVLQVKYEGPAEEFGWLVPVPGLPRVREGSMDCFYELSKLTQKQSSAGTRGRGPGDFAGGAASPVEVIKVETIGAYQVAVLAAGKAGPLARWLRANGFNFPKDKQSILDDYIRKGWYFVAAKINPNLRGFSLTQGEAKETVNKNISRSIRAQMSSGELHPIIISFPSESCIFPLAISAANGKPSEVSLYVFSAEPFLCRMLFEKRLALYCSKRADWIKQASERPRQREWWASRYYSSWPLYLVMDDDPADPAPRPLSSPAVSSEWDEEFHAETPLLKCMEAGPEQLTTCAQALPRLADKGWWLTKEVQTFSPEEMTDLVFEPASSVLFDELGTPAAVGAAACLPQFGVWALPAIEAAAHNPDAGVRRFAALALRAVPDDAVEIIMSLLGDPDPHTRARAAEAAGKNWNLRFVPLLLQLFSDNDPNVRRAAGTAIARNQDKRLYAICQKMLHENGPAAPAAFIAVAYLGPSRSELLPLLSSTNQELLNEVLPRLSPLSLDELPPLLTNSLAMARQIGLDELGRIPDNAAVDRIVSMLPDPDETVRWRVRATLRRVSGQNLGPDPAAYQKWWAENKDTFTPKLFKPASPLRFRRGGS